MNCQPTRASVRCRALSCRAMVLVQPNTSSIRLTMKKPDGPPRPRGPARGDDQSPDPHPDQVARGRTPKENVERQVPEPEEGGHILGEQDQERSAVP